MIPENVSIQSGDIFLIDSKKTGPKIVKFLQTAPTVWQHLWRKLRGTQEEVLYYHVGMFLTQEQIIEQQAKVIEKSSHKVLNTSDRLFIARRKWLSPNQRLALVEEAFEDLEKGYDVLNCFGKFLTWLTGIKLFARYMEAKDKEICINRVAQWYANTDIDKFGVPAHSELTTHTMYKYIKAHPEIWEIVYEGIPNVK